ncbi:unnamed protein product [Nezara viridula]|uniref:Uncharacterized protein n=1 Tax=Nezara viridula TaxID=85310 RepID=A0A9P0HFE1_NEZVI|nr:unnamed protein product [Nezara viridula]
MYIRRIDLNNFANIVIKLDNSVVSFWSDKLFIYINFIMHLSFV